MVLKMRLMAMTWLLLGVVVCGSMAWAAAPPEKAFTPIASIQISFPKSDFNRGEATTATVTISGRTGGATVIASVSGPGVVATSVDVTSGSGSVDVAVPDTSGSYTYSASATIDGTGVSDSTTINVGSNRPPVATDGTATTDEDTPCTIYFSATDPDGDGLAFSPGSPYAYTPPQDFYGTDIITFTADDGHGGTDTGVVTVTVNPVNDAPEANDLDIETDEDIPVDVTLSGFDIDGDTLTYAIAGGPSHGTLGTLDPDTHVVTYTPNPNWEGPDSFTFTVSDGALSDTGTVSITVKPVGDNVGLGVGRYLLADGADHCPVSVSVVNEHGVPQAGISVTLSTSGGTLTATALTTDANGLASTTLTSSTTTGEMTVEASIDGDKDQAKVTFFIFEVKASLGTAVPDTTPPMSASGLGKTGETIAVNLTTTPTIDLTDGSLGLTWTGGEGTDNSYRTVAKDTPGQEAVSATLRGSSQEVEVVVIAVTAIVKNSTPLEIVTSDPLRKHAVTTWTATPGAKAELLASITPDVPAVHAVYSSLLVWSGGETGETPDKRTISRSTPSKTDIKVTCGESGDAVCAWVAKVNVDIAGVSDSEEDTKWGTIYPNTDDDDFTATAVPLYNGSDLDEAPVPGEDDLVAITLTVEPEDIGGALTLTHGGRVQLYHHRDKSGATPPASWDLSTRLDTEPSNDIKPPVQLWVEGREVSQLAGDQEFTLTHTWGGLSCSDTIKATVQARAGDSEVALQVVRPATNALGRLIPGPEKYDPIGGTMYIAVQIKLGPGERLDPSMNSITVKAQDDYAYTGPPAMSTGTLNFSTVSEWYELINPGTAQAQWVPATTAPNSANGNREGSVPKVYCGLLKWNTPFTPSLNFRPPMGHNGAHTVAISQVNGVNGDQVALQHFIVPNWQTAYHKSVPPTKATVKNLVVKKGSVSTSNGTEDYFKYDTDPTSTNNRPTISFTIEDDGDTHEYDAYILMWPTGVTGNLFTGLRTSDVIAWTEDRHLGTGRYSKTWDGSFIPSTWASHEADAAEKSTYAFEVCVFEYPNATRGQYIDWFYLKWPYCLSIFNDEHNVWVQSAIDRDELRCDYIFRDYANNEGMLNAEVPSDLTLIPVGDDLSLLSSPITVPNGGTLNIWHNGDDARGIFTYCSQDIQGKNRVIFTAIDTCWVEYRRDHCVTRMLAVNDGGLIYPFWLMWFENQLVDFAKTMFEAKWTPQSEGYKNTDSGAFGKAISKQILDRIHGKYGFYANVQVDKINRQVRAIATNTTLGSCYEIDVIKCRDGYQPVIGQILDPKKIEFAGEVKSSLYGDVSIEQIRRYEFALGSKEVPIYRASPGYAFKTKLQEVTDQVKYCDKVKILKNLAVAGGAAHQMKQIMNMARDARDMRTAEWINAKNAIYKIVADNKMKLYDTDPNNYNLDMADVADALTELLTCYMSATEAAGIVRLVSTYAVLRNWR